MKIRSRGMLKGENYLSAGLDQLGPKHVQSHEVPSMPNLSGRVLSIRERQDHSIIQRKRPITLPVIKALPEP